MNNNFISYFFLLVMLFIIFNNKKKNIIEEIKGSKESFGGINKLHITTDIIKKTCDDLNLKYIINNNNIIKVFYKNKSILFEKYINNINTDKLNIQYKKPNISTLLLNNNIKVPIFETFNKITSLNYINYIINNNKINYPLVIKPQDSTGGIKVFVNIQNKSELKNILIKHFLNKNILSSKTNTVMIETYLEGLDYRILCYKNKIIDVVNRTPPFIIGNNKNTIKELIDLENNNRKKKGIYIMKYNETYLNNKNLFLNTILKKNQNITINPISNFHQGGILKRIKLSMIHPDNINMFKKINSILKLNLSGIDFIIKDITKSYKNQNCGINEVNTNPNFDIHYYANYTVDPINKFFKLYFNITN